MKRQNKIKPVTVWAFLLKPENILCQWSMESREHLIREIEENGVHNWRSYYTPVCVRMILNSQYRTKACRAAKKTNKKGASSC